MLGKNVKPYRGINHFGTVEGGRAQHLVFDGVAGGFGEISGGAAPGAGTAPPPEYWRTKETSGFKDLGRN